MVDGRQYEAREPALKPGVAGAICFDGDAALRPDRYVDELARVVRERGGTIVEQCALQGLDHDGNGVRMRTAQGELRARDAVLALGAWSPRLADAVGLPFLKRAMQPGKGYSITYSRADPGAAAAADAARPLGLRHGLGQRVPPRQHDGVFRLRRHRSTSAGWQRWSAGRASTCTSRSVRSARSSGSAGGR